MYEVELSWHVLGVPVTVDATVTPPSPGCTGLRDGGPPEPDYPAEAVIDKIAVKEHCDAVFDVGELESLSPDLVDAMREAAIEQWRSDEGDRRDADGDARFDAAREERALRGEG